MVNLLSASLLRLKKDRLFWLTAGAALVLSVFSMLNDCRQAAGLWETYQVSYPLEHYYFNQVPAVGIYLAVFLSLFLGTEYSDGTVRNKMIVGHSRACIYLSNLIVCSLAALAVLAMILLGGLVGLPFLEPWQAGPVGLATGILVSAGFTLALASLFTLVGMLSARKSATAVLSMLLCLGLLMASSLIYSRLCEPEMISGMVFTVQGGIQAGPPMPNPDYVGGTMRAALEAILNILPTGQAVLLANGEAARPVFQLLASLGIILAAGAVGMSLFEKKDLK